MNVRTLLLTIVTFTTGLSTGALIPIYFISTNFKAEEPSCSLEKAFREISIGETAYCKSFKLYRRDDESFIVYEINYNINNLKLARRQRKKPEHDKYYTQKKSGRRKVIINN